jgi:hypothetical protein
MERTGMGQKETANAEEDLDAQAPQRYETVSQPRDKERKQGLRDMVPWVYLVGCARPYA